MGDRCYFKIYVNKKNQDDALRVIYHGYSASADEVKEEEGGAVSIVDYEMNYGGCEERGELSDMGIPFYGRHDAGGGYGPCAFAGYADEEVEVSTDMDGWPVVRVDTDTMQIDSDGIKNIEDYKRVLKLAMDAVHGR